MKNIFRLFERPFEIQKNGVFLSLFSFQRYCHFCIMQIDMMTSQDLQLKNGKILNKKYSGNIEAVP